MKLARNEKTWRQNSCEEKQNDRWKVEKISSSSWLDGMTCKDYSRILFWAKICHTGQ